MRKLCQQDGGLESPNTCLRNEINQTIITCQWKQLWERSRLQQRSGGKPAELRYQGWLYRKTQEAFYLYCSTPESKDQSLATVVFQLSPRARVRPLTDHPQDVLLLHPAPEAKDANRAVPFHLRLCWSLPHIWGPSHCTEPQSPRRLSPMGDMPKSVPTTNRRHRKHTYDLGPVCSGSCVYPWYHDMALLLHWVPVYPTWHWEGTHWLKHRPQTKKSKRIQQPLPLRIIIALAITATQRTSADLATENPYNLCQKWPQLMEMHRDHATVASQKPEMLNPIQLAPSELTSRKIFPHRSQSEKG